MHPNNNLASRPVSQVFLFISILCHSFTSLKAAGSCAETQALPLSRACVGKGSSLAWSGLGNTAVNCSEPVVSGGDTIFTPDGGTEILILLPSSVSVDPLALSVACTLGPSAELLISGQVLTSQSPETKVARYAVFCVIPAYTALPAILQNVNLSVPLNATVDGISYLRSPSSQIMYFAISQLSPSFGLSKGGTTITVHGTNLQQTGMVPVCSFHFTSASPYNTSAPWSEATLFQTSSRTFGNFATFSPSVGALICEQPPLPPHLVGNLAVSVSPDQTTLPLSLDLAFTLTDASIASVTVARSTTAGGMIVTVVGQGFSTGQGSVPDAPKCRFGSLAVSGTIVSDSGIECSVPAQSTQTLPIELSLNAQAFFSGEAQLEYFPATTLTSVSPADFPHGGGTIVTVAGSNFQFDSDQHAASCRFTVTIGSVSVATTADGTVVSSSVMTCTTPVIGLSTSVPSASGILEVSFNAENNGGPQWSPSLTFTSFLAPVVDTLDPSIVCAFGGTTLSVRGSHFDSSSSRAAACIFAHTAAGSTSTSLVNAVRASSTLITCAVPAAPVTVAQLDVCVSFNGGADCSNTVALAVYASTAIAPTSGPASGGTVVKIALNAAHSPSLPSVCTGVACASCLIIPTVGGVTQTTLGSIGSLVGGTLSCTTPPQTALQTPLLFSLNNQIDICGDSGFVFYPDPVGISVTPSTGPITGGTLVNITGSNFYLDSAGASPMCSFGGATVPAILSQCDGTACAVAVCTTPAVTSAGLVAVLLSFNGQQYQAVSTFEYYAIPVVQSITPSACPNTGGTPITVSGQFITSGTNSSRLCLFWPQKATRIEKVRLGSEAAMTVEATVVGDSVVCPCPANSKLNEQSLVVWLAPNGQQFQVNSVALIMHKPIVVRGFTPLSANVLALTEVFAVGENFLAGAGLVIIFGAQKVQATWVREGVIKVSVRGDAIATVPVSVSNNDGIDTVVASQSLSFFSGGLNCPDNCGLLGTCSSGTCVCDAGYCGSACTFFPVIAHLFPTYGSVDGGERLAVRGVSLGGECAGAALSASWLFVRVNGGTEYSATYDTATREVRVLTRTRPAGTKWSIEVSFDNKVTWISSGDADFTFGVNAQVIAAIPTSGISGGDTLVTVFGSGFHPNKDLRCRFGSSGSTAAYAVSSTRLVCGSPPALATGVTVLDVSNNNQDYTVTFESFRYYNVSVPYQVLPTFGAFSGGTSVTVRGSSELVPSQVCTCQFDNRIVPATVRENSVFCISPAVSSAGVVAFAVLLDGQHASCAPTSSNGFCQYLYFSNLELSSVFPAAATGQHNVTLTVTGAGFLANPSAKCRFGAAGSAVFASTALTVQSETVGVCDVPSVSTAGVVAFAITINGADAVSYAPGFTFYARPTISRVAPAGSVLAGGATITVEGAGFQQFNSAIVCRFASGGGAGYEPVAPADSVIGTTAVTCLAPASTAAGASSVEIALQGDQDGAGAWYAIGAQWSDPAAFLYYREGVVDSVKPWEGFTNGGALVTLLGSGLAGGGEFTRCKFGDAAAAGTVLGWWGVVCRSPAQSAGFVPVRVSLNGQSYSASIDRTFTAYPAPSVSSLSPSVSPVSGGARLRVQGAGFRSAHLASCYLKSTAAIASAAVSPATVVGTSVVLCDSPPMASPGAYTLQISINDDGAGDGEPLGSGLSFTYHANPVVVAMTPSVGVLEGGTTVTISGQNLAVGSSGESNVCQFGTLTASAVALANGDMVCTAPASPLPDASSVTVRVSRDGGNFFAPSGVSFAYFPTPSVSSVTPSVGVIAGGTVVTAAGQGFRATQLLSCRFGSSVVSGTLSVSGCNTTVICISPPSTAGSVAFGVSLNAQAAEFSVQAARFIFHVPVEITFAGPSAGPFFGGTLVTFSGATVFESRDSVCKFGSQIRAATFVPPQSVTCVAPADTVGTQLVVQTSLNNQEFAGTSMSFLYTVLPQVTGASPLLGPEEQGSTITIRGQDFVGTTHSACKVGNNTSPATVVSSTEARCTAVPIRRKRISAQLQDWFNTTDPVPLTREANSRTGLVEVAFAVDGQFFSEVVGNYTYYMSPSVFRVLPASAPLSGPDVTVTVNGSDFRLNLTGAAGGFTGTPRCKFGTAVGAATVVSDSMILCSARRTGVGEAVAVAVALNGVDFEHHNSAFFLWLAPAPAVQAVVVSPALSQVLLTFADPTDRGSFRTTNGTAGCGEASVLCPVLYEAPLLSGSFKCETMLAPPTLSGVSWGTGSFGGTGPFCYWIDNSTLALQMGYAATLAAGDPMDVTQFAIMRGTELSYTIEPGTLPALALPSGLSSPRISLSAPNAIGPCDPLVLDGALSDNGGGRQLFFRWTLLSPTGTAQADQIAALLSASSGPEQDATFLRCRVGTCSSASIDASLLSAGDYSFKLQVTSWVGTSASAAVSVSVRTTDVPLVRIRGPRHVNASRGQDLVLEAVASAPGCGATTGNIEFEWMLQIPGDTTNVLPGTTNRFSPFLVIPAFFLDPSVTYIASLEAFMSLSPAVSSSAAVTVSTVATQPISRVLGGDRTVSASKILVLDGSKSYDPDLSPAENAASPLNLQWDCTAELRTTGATASCRSLNSNFQLVPDQATRTASVPLTSGALPLPADANYVFVFSLTASRAGSSASAKASVRITVTASQVLPVELKLVSLARFSPNDKLEALAVADANATVAWSAPWSGIDLSLRRNLVAAPSATLLVAPGVFAPGVNYRLRVRATLNGLSGSAEVEVRANAAPNSGAFFISPTVGFAMSELFRLVATGWTDDLEDLPLTYTFSWKGTQGWWAPVTVGGSAPFVEAYLAQGEAPSYLVALALHVRDQLGAETTTDLCANEATDVGVGAELAACRVKVEPYAAGTPLASGISLMEFYKSTDFDPVVQAQDRLAAVSLMNSIASVLDANTVAAGGGRRDGDSDAGEWVEAGHSGRPSRGLLQISEEERLKLVALRTAMIAAMERLASNSETLNLDVVTSLAQYVVPSPPMLPALNSAPCGALGMLHCSSSTLTAARTRRSLLLISEGTGQLSSALISRALALANSLCTALASVKPVLSSSPLLANLTSSLSRSLYLHHSASSIEFSNSRATAADCQAQYQTLIFALRALAYAGAARHSPGQDAFLFSSPLFRTYVRVIAPVSSSSSFTSFGPKLAINLEGVGVSVPVVAVSSDSIVGGFTIDVSGLPLQVTPLIAQTTSVSVNPAGQVRFFDPAPSEPHIGQIVDVHAAWAGIASGAYVLANWEAAAPLTIQMAVNPVPNSSLIDATTGRRRLVGCVWWAYQTPIGWSVNGVSLQGVEGNLATCQASSVGVSATFTALDSDGGCDNLPRSRVVYDRCFICGGTNQCVDCADVPFGPLRRDECGVCGGSFVAANCTGCDGRIYAKPTPPPVDDDCGVCGGYGNDRGCDGKCFSAKGVDQCGVCGGDGLQCQAPPFFTSPFIVTAAGSPPPGCRKWLAIVVGVFALLWRSGAFEIDCLLFQT